MHQNEAGLLVSELLCAFCPTDADRCVAPSAKNHGISPELSARASAVSEWRVAAGDKASGGSQWPE